MSNRSEPDKESTNSIADVDVPVPPGNRNRFTTMCESSPETGSTRSRTRSGGTCEPREERPSGGAADRLPSLLSGDDREAHRSL
ncbi:unnamed protein product [Cutaneotrichosporon oleaginosum]